MKILLPLLITAFVFKASASTELSLTDFVSGEVRSLESAFADVGPLDESISSQNEEFILRRFWLRVRPKVGLSIPGLAAFDIIPEVEMLWEKEVPEGWETYKP
mgnify:CR=1 FL=1